MEPEITKIEKVKGYKLEGKFVLRRKLVSGGMSVIHLAKTDESSEHPSD